MHSGGAIGASKDARGVQKHRRISHKMAQARAVADHEVGASRTGRLTEEGRVHLDGQ